MKEKINNNGITLIALVITIIVLLILAMVSIRIVLDGGLISKAKSATDQHAKGAEEEAIQLAYAEYQISQYSNDTIDEANIKDENLKSDYKNLKDYFLEKDLSDFLIENETTDDIAVLKYNNERLTINIKEDVIEDGNITYFTIFYNGYFYKFKVEYIIDNGKEKTTIKKIEVLDKKIKIDNATITRNTEINGWNIEFNDTHNKYEISENGTVSNITNAWWKMTAEEKKELENYKFVNSGVGNEVGYEIKFPKEEGSSNYPLVVVYKNYGIENVYIVCIMTNDGIYFYLTGDNSVNAYFSKMEENGYTIDKTKTITAGKWYKSMDGSNLVNGEEYTGEPLITEADLNSSDTHSRTYLEKIMKSFN